MNETQNENLVKKYFKIEPNGGVTFIGSKLVVIIPDKYFRRGVAKIVNTNIITMGIFEGYIFDDVNEEDLAKAEHKYVLKAPNEITLVPSHIEKYAIEVEDSIEETLCKETVYELIFLQGDTYMANISVVSSLEVMKEFMEMIFFAYIPSTLNYVDTLKIWDKCNRDNGGGALKSNFSLLAAIIATLVRCPDDLSVPFRFKWDWYFDKHIYNGKLIRVYDAPKNTNSYSALTSADPKYGITVAIERRRAEHKKDDISPIEEVIQ
jgi:hypothetical protein